MAFISHYESMDDSESIDIRVNEGDDLLIDLVVERPWLYDKASKGYSDQIMTYNAWKDISIVMNDTIENCKACWQKMVNHYSREKLLIDKETRSGSAASKRRSWPFFQRMQSLLQKSTQQFTSNSFTDVVSTPPKTPHPQKCFTGNKPNKRSNNQRIDLIQSVFNNCNATISKIEKQLHEKPRDYKSVNNPDKLFGMLIESELNGMDPKIAKKKRKLLMKFLSELDSDSD